MNALRYALLVLHFVGLAAILGPVLEQLRAETKRLTMVMVWGARAQIVTGLALAGLAFARADETGYEPDHVKIAVKMLIALAIAGIAESSRKRENPVVQFWLVGALTLVNVIVAVAWR
ncbi:hypothetical protein [Demequina mangrovi]|uniref:Integral membrane protein n=1 Tax=Demequina mangrovi TaxID=1043493 RepID=A0A1H6UCE8_9MICO|nr:hypothetical protein [Demequina mangrovi]SEI89256.1 hypothetical protein SAMN05421637_0327 [Demequina mangrovi]